MKNDPLSACVGLGRTRDIDAIALEVVGPQRAVAAARGAIARSRRFGRPFEAPLNRAAVARTMDHFVPLRPWSEVFVPHLAREGYRSGRHRTSGGQFWKSSEQSRP